jgi:hypothetical protein
MQLVKLFSAWVDTVSTHQRINLLNLINVQFQLETHAVVAQTLQPPELSKLSNRIRARCESCDYRT